MEVGSEASRRQGAFYRCKHLRKATLNEGLETLGTDEFSSANHDNGNCNRYSNMRELDISECARMGEGYRAYHGVFQESALESIVFPSTLKTIEYSALYDCRSLRSTELPEGLMKVGKQCFYETGLEEIVLSAGLKDIGDGAFYGYNNPKVIWADSDRIADVKSAIFNTTAVLSKQTLISGRCL